MFSSTTFSGLAAVFLPLLLSWQVNVAEGGFFVSSPVATSGSLRRQLKKDKDVETYDEYYWEDLSENVQAAAIELGFDEELWNIGGVTSTTSTSWEDLTEAQQEAAAELGYNEKGWDKQEYHGCYNDFHFEDMPEAQKNAAILIGYDADMWDNDKDPEIEEKCWNQTTLQERGALELFCFTEALWNGDDEECDDEE